MNKILHGDSIEVLKTLDADSVDLVCTDPPYGYSFMGKSWDKTLPDIGIFKECVRVLKPGAFAFVMSAPRSDVCARMMLLLEDAGFNIGFTSLYWTYASGFPKAMNIGKMVDKRHGAIRHGAWSENHFAKPVQYETGEAITQDAKALDGSYGGFQPKPAVEVIIVAMKPLSEKTFVDQALKNGKGITWLDDARIPVEGFYAGAGGRGKHGRGEGYGFKPTGLRTVPVHSKDKKKDETIWGLHPTIQHERVETSLGRFPANLLVSDDVLNDGRITKAIKANRGRGYGDGVFTNDCDYKGTERGFADSGSYSRYFSLDAWAKTLPFLIVPKASKREKTGGLQDRESETVGDGRPIAIDNAFQRGKTERKNIHPTVKPLQLFAYLITLGSRPGDVVLDPFLGSGTTAIAAKQLGRNYIGIEREDEYVKIAEARIAAVAPSLL